MSFNSKVPYNNNSNALPSQTDFQLQINNFATIHENNHEFIELLTALNSYKKSTNPKVPEQPSKTKHFQQQSFNELLYSKLEILLHEVAYLRSKEARNARIHDVYKWFHKTLSDYDNTLKIKLCTAPKENEILTEEEANINNPEYQFKVEEFYRKKDEGVVHRSHIPIKVASISELVKEMKVKHLNPVGNNMNTSNNNNTGVVKGKEGNKETFRSSIGMRSTFYSTYKSSRSGFYNTNASLNWQQSMKNIQDRDIREVEPSKEIKNSYSYMRPNFNYTQLQAEKYVSELKNRELAEKRNIEEMKYAINDFGHKKSRFKMNNQLKFEMKQIISKYSKLLKDEEDKEEEQRRLLFFKDDIGVNDDNKNNEVHNVQHPNSDNDSNNNNNLKPKVDFTSKATVSDLSNEQQFSFQMLINKENSMQQIYTSIINNDVYDDGALSSDIITNQIHNDKKFKTRMLISSLCNVKYASPRKTNYNGFLSPLSGYDNVNYKSFYNNRFIYERGQQQRTSNLLEMRHSLSSFKLTELNKLKANKEIYRRIVLSDEEDDKKQIEKQRRLEKDNKLRNKRGKIKELKESASCIHLKSLEGAFLTPEHKSKAFFPRVYLPRSGSGLLQIPEFKEGKKK